MTFRRPQSARNKAAIAGFTLVELMIVLAILAVIMTIAAPAFRNTFLATRLSTYSNSLVSSVYLARGEAIKRNRDIRLCASSDGATCAASGDWSQGWVVLDPNDTVLSRQEPVQDGYSMVDGGGALTVAFDATGLASPAVDIKICQQSPEVGPQERQVSVTTIGRTNVERTTTGTCP